MRRGAAASGGRRRARVPAFVPLGVLLVGVLSLLHRLDREAAAQGVATIDLTRYRLHHGDRWVCDAWLASLERVLASAGELAADDREGIRRLASDVGSLSFVAEVGEVEVDWPDGLNVPLRLRRPVACLKVGDDFLPVADDGTVLSGYSYAPHPAPRGGYLPVLGPHGLGRDRDAPFEPGDVLAHAAYRDALAVAASLADHLDAASRERLGRIVVDASRETAYDGLPGGVFLDLEGARRIHFGRPPGSSAPGELPLATKWTHVRDALARWEDGESFDAFDARWDAPKPLRFEEAAGSPGR